MVFCLLILVLVFFFLFSSRFLFVVVVGVGCSCSLFFSVSNPQIYDFFFVIRFLSSFFFFPSRPVLPLGETNRRAIFFKFFRSFFFFDLAVGFFSDQFPSSKKNANAEST